jgi:hypothetical protein
MTSPPRAASPFGLWLPLAPVEYADWGDIELPFRFQRAAQ